MRWLIVFLWVCSLQATWIYHQIQGALRQTQEDAVSAKLPSTCVYRAPTIHQLTETISGLFAGSGGHHATEEELQTRRLQALLDRYTTNFPARPAALRKRAEGQDVVFVTGTTGGLGSHLLQHLLEDATVGRVYAFNRPSATLERQQQTFRTHGLDVSWLSSPKLVLLRGNLGQPFLGLEPTVYGEVSGT